MTMRSIFLIGFRGVGKSSLGEACARTLGWSFLDTDRILTEQNGISLAEYVEKFGLDKFREEEYLVILNILKSPPAKPTLIALGGGFVDNPDSLKIVKAACSEKRFTCLHLICDFTEILDRLWASNISRAGPWKSAEELHALWQKREKSFSALTDVFFDSSSRDTSAVEKKLSDILTGLEKSKN